MIAGIPPRFENGAINKNNIEKICVYFKQAGVKDLAVIHSPEGSYCMGNDGYLLYVPSVNLPEGSIKGKVGAGDAFTAGVLCALCNGADNTEAMRIGNGAAAMSLLGGNVINGVSSAAAALALYEKYNGMVRV
jgi:sugar/nucleoside kinase (ribokinase family)